ncbi:two-component sensor histidine kinase, partial [Streptomyces wedmorensis]
LYAPADEQVHPVADRAAGPPVAVPPVPGPLDPVRAKEPLAFVQGPGAPIGTLGAVLTDGEVTSAGYSAEAEGSDRYGRNVQTTELDAAQRAALAAVPRDGRPHTVELPGGLGSYRVEYAVGIHGEFLTGIPLAEVEDALSTL